MTLYTLAAELAGEHLYTNTFAQSFPDRQMALMHMFKRSFLYFEFAQGAKLRITFPHIVEDMLLGANSALANPQPREKGAKPIQGFTVSAVKITSDHYWHRNSRMADLSNAPSVPSALRD